LWNVPQEDSDGSTTQEDMRKIKPREEAKDKRKKREENKVR